MSAVSVNETADPAHPERMILIPKKRAPVIGFAGLLFLTAPAVAAWYFRVEQANGVYPSDADSIGIPIFGFIVLLILTAPLTWGFVWLCVRRYPGAVPLTAWNSARPIWSIFWSSIAFVAALFLVVIAISADVRHHPLLIVHVALDVIFLLVLRSAIIMQVTAGDPLRTATR